MLFSFRSKKHNGPEKSAMNLPAGFTWKVLNTTVMEVIKKQIKRGQGEHNLNVYEGKKDVY